MTASKLMGRGGAAFPTGRKWAAVRDQAAQPHYLVCNADESEPGTFKDRVLVEGDPFAIVEAMTIAAFATGASQGLVALLFGHVLVPINKDLLIVDLIEHLKLPVLVVALSTLGTINHTLLTLAALHAAELPVHGVVLIGDQNRENRETIERFGHVRVIGEIPRLPNLHRTALMQVFMSHFDRGAFSQ